MTRLLRLKGQGNRTHPRKIGFRVVRTRGSHTFLKHADGRATVVPVHLGETIGPGLLRAILRDVEMSVKSFLERP